MKYINSDDFQLTDSAVALGKFEGIHRGHQLLLNEVKKQKKHHLQSVVFTFDRPPGTILGRDGEKKSLDTCTQIYTREERYRILKDLGIDQLIEFPFTREFACLSPEEFIRDVLVDKTGARVVVVGTDFRFGRGRSGSVEDLRHFSEIYGFDLLVMDKLREGQSDISSSRVRDLLGLGRMEEADGLLGRPYFISGPVIHGRELGRTIQIPTANLAVQPCKLTPPNGVYITKTHLGEESFFGITNIGVKPTVESDSRKGAETYIFDFDRDVYGEEIQVDLLHYCRPEQKFDSVAHLQEQMARDISSAREYINQRWKGKIR